MIRIYALPVQSSFQPEHQPFRYPPHNDDYGVEQDFSLFLQRNPRFVTDTPAQADWHYLPIYWTRWHLNHDFGSSGLDELQREVSRVLLDDSKTFTICQYDDGTLVDLGRSRLFLASRKTAEGVDIPLLAATNRRPLFPPGRQYLASFAGRLNTHPIRGEMALALAERSDVYLYDGQRSRQEYVRLLLKSRIALCPRGYGGSSFRFYEAMQLGIVPFLIGDIDTRPFKAFIDWERISLYASNADAIITQLERYEHEALSMGRAARAVFMEQLAYQRWCKHVVALLEKMR